MTIEIILAVVYTAICLVSYITEEKPYVFIVLIGQILCAVIVWKWALGL